MCFLLVIGTVPPSQQFAENFAAALGGLDTQIWESESQPAQPKQTLEVTLQKRVGFDSPLAVPSPPGSALQSPREPGTTGGTCDGPSYLSQVQALLNGEIEGANSATGPKVERYISASEALLRLPPFGDDPKCRGH